MTPVWSTLLDWAPALALLLARLGAMMILLPGLGEASAPAIVRLGLTLGLAVLLLPEVQPAMPAVPAAGLDLGLMVASEIVTGLWFGWVVRMITLALPVGAQLISYMIGLSNILQPDQELGAQASLLSKLFEMAVPVLLLASGLYRIPLNALVGLFGLIPPGHLLPVADTTEIAIRAVSSGFALAVQMASPFIVLAIGWHVALGLVARIVSRMQIYFISMPGQIAVGMALLAITSGTMIVVWQDAVRIFMGSLPGNG